MINKLDLLFRHSFLLCFLCMGHQSLAQTNTSLNIDSCYVMANRNYPLVKQYELIQKSKEYSISNAAKGYLPQLNVNGQATYQSDVTSIPFNIPGITQISKDQYRVYAEVSQPITDLFTVKAQKDFVESTAEVESQKLNVELYKLKERINQLYFGILLLDAQIVQTDLLMKDIQSGIDKTKAAIANGVALKSNADMLEAELLKAGQKRIELKSNRKGFADMLSLFINQAITDSTKLESPVLQNKPTENNRPELKMYDSQHQTYEFQRKLIIAKNLPHLNFFFQGGLGRPALNMLDNEMKSYYITGLRLNWNISGLYTYSKEKKILNVNQKALDLQRETFKFNTSLSTKQQDAEIEKLAELISSDQKIIALRESVKLASKIQLEYGTITTLDFLTNINAEDLAKQNLLLHQIQLMLAHYNYQTTLGKD